MHNYTKNGKTRGPIEAVYFSHPAMESIALICPAVLLGSKSVGDTTKKGVPAKGFSADDVSPCSNILGETAASISKFFACNSSASFPNCTILISDSRFSSASADSIFVWNNSSKHKPTTSNTNPIFAERCLRFRHPLSFISDQISCPSKITPTITKSAVLWRNCHKPKAWR
jgi:hypothetical protein